MYGSFTITTCRELIRVVHAAQSSWHTFYFCSTFFLKESYTSTITDDIFM